MKRPSLDWNCHALSTHESRLIPPPKSKPELTATTTLLSVLGSVDEFGSRFMRRVGGPRYSNLHRYYRAFCEVPVSVLEQVQGVEADRLASERKPPWGTHDRPDGVIVVSRNKEWRALVEVKTGTETLCHEQVAAYHKIAQHFGFDALITISNEPGTRTGDPPATALKSIRPAQRKRLPVVHVQWRSLLGDAATLNSKHLEDNVADEDQDWILGQWVKFIKDERSEVLIPATLGSSWNKVLQLAKKRLLLRDTKELADVVAHWGDLSREIEFKMRIAGVKITPRLNKRERESQVQRCTSLIEEAINARTFTLRWKCSAPVETLYCVVDLDARLVRYYFDVKTFSGRSAAARIMCWTSQIETENREEVVVRPKWKKPSIETPILLSDCHGAKQLNQFLRSKGIDRSTGTPTRLSFEWHRSLKRSSGRKGQIHLEQICSGVLEFYSAIMAGLRSVEALPVEIRDTPSATAVRSAAVGSSPETSSETPHKS